MFFSAWIFGSMSFFSISSCARCSALSACFKRAVVGGDGGVLLRPPLADLLLEIVQLGLLVERVADLLLAVELDEQIAGMHGLPGAHERRDDQGVVVLAGEARRRDGRGFHGFDRATQTQALDEIAAGHLERLRPRIGLRFGRAGVRIEPGAHDGSQHSGSDDDFRFQHARVTTTVSGYQTVSVT